MLNIYMNALFEYRARDLLAEKEGYRPGSGITGG